MRLGSTLSADGSLPIKDVGSVQSADNVGFQDISYHCHYIQTLSYQPKVTGH